MSSATTKDLATVQTTRQMLDELDVLMERMLALPIEDGDGNDETGAAPAVAATLTLLDAPGESAPEAPPEPIDEAAPVHEAPAPLPAPTPVYLTPAPAVLEPASEPDPEPGPMPMPVEAALPTPEVLTPLPPRLRPRPALGYRFLLWVNRGYDRSTLWLGRRGTWLRGRLFRLLLGLAGAALLAGSVAWLVWDWLGRQR